MRESRGTGLLSLAAWLCGAMIVIWLISRVGWDSVVDTLRRRAGLGFVGYILFAIALPLPLDAWATGRAISRLGIRISFRELLLGRSASYLAGVLNYAIGQGSMVWLLTSRGIPTAQSAGAMLFVLSTTGLATVVFAFFGSLLGPTVLRSGPLTCLPMVTGLIVAGYLPALTAARRFGWLQRIPALTTLLAASPRDHLSALLTRVPHLALMSVLGWGTFRAWGLPLPWGIGVAAVPVFLLLASLPATPSGLGTVQAAQVLMLSPFLDGVPRASAESEILACSLTGHALGLAGQVAIGLLGFARLRRHRERETVVRS